MCILRLRGGVRRAAGERDPLSYGHIRDFFGVVPAGIGQRERAACFIELGCMIYDTASRSRSITRSLSRLTHNV